MRVRYKFLASLTAIGMVLFGATNVFAAPDDPVTIYIDEPTFYDAFKECTLNGPTDAEWTVVNYAAVSPAQEELIRGGCWTEASKGVAVFNDDDMSITYPNQAALEKVEHIHLQGMGITNIDDLAKFPNLVGSLMNDNLVEEVNLHYNSMHAAISLVRNPLDHIPDYYLEIIDNASNPGDIIQVFSTLLTDLNFEEEYYGYAYVLPEIITQIKWAFDDIEYLTSDNLMNQYGSRAELMRQIGEFYTIDNWLYLENARVSEDFTRIIPIDPDKEIVISFRNTWEQTQESPFFKMCQIPGYEDSHLCDSDGHLNETGAANMAALYNTLRFMQSSDEYANIATFRAKRVESPVPNPNSIQINDTDLYNALKYCAEVTPAHLLDDDYFEEHIYTDAVVCENLENGTFDDKNQTITFIDEYDLNAVETIVLNNMGLKNIDELEKFPSLQEVFVINNEIEETHLFDDITLNVHSMGGALIITGNHLRVMPKIYDFDIEDEDGIGEFFEMLLITRAIYLANQTIEDTYDGDIYEMLNFIERVQASFDYMANTRDQLIAEAEQDPNFNADDENFQAEIAMLNYYTSDNWLRLENATMSEDHKHLIPIDNTKDMKISYCQTWENMATESPIVAEIMSYGGGQQFMDLFQTLLGSDTDGCVLRATIKHKAPQEETVDPIEEEEPAETTEITNPESAEEEEEPEDVVAPTNPITLDDINFGVIATVATLSVAGLCLIIKRRMRQ